jgi:hypothetical protein
VEALCQVIEILLLLSREDEEILIWLAEEDCKGAQYVYGQKFLQRALCKQELLLLLRAVSLSSITLKDSIATLESILQTLFALSNYWSGFLQQE